ncbi:hypothetical protein HMPREF9622_01390 [Cutibacterium modestum HL037PA3]|uniref:Uncharacterized protein n=1 Tax=Cutibacterium modestum HL044PA1 TaxID=765109 RepID=A0ABP2K8H5_9ACTN|nr:hypothetical protein HMPREF9621_01004 [Cutibacterium modestum HL037PA2]EFS93228.1 hypothetical protein HMPREF9607_00440 [Cutibacterium modestum HL044PA1]EFT15615.1 hypothetical protein HMPREF9622_01390 [Cutibacterium modestum HL037PA3]
MRFATLWIRESALGSVHATKQAPRHGRQTISSHIKFAVHDAPRQSQSVMPELG